MRHKISLFSLLLIIIIAFVVQLSDRKWNADFGVVQADVKGYYAYLPLVFIYDDLKVDNPEDYEYKNDHRLWYSTAEDGTRYIKFTMGVAMLYAPFFFISHLLAETLGFPADGFSLPYQVLLAMSSLFYLVIGIFVIRKLLLRFFKDKIVAITLMVIYLGTNLFYYYTINMCVSHGYSFAMIALFLYSSILWLESARYKHIILMGLSAGLMILIRPVDVIIIMFPMLFNVRNRQNLADRLKFFKQHFLQLLILGLLVVSVIAPQLFYWKYITGSYLFFSYEDEQFYFLKTNILNAVFSFHNGWLIYSPLMLIGIAGIFLLKKRLPEFLTPSLIIIPVYIFIIASWWCWWYVGFGNRAFINLYPLLCIGTAAFIHYLSETRKIIRIATYSLVSFLIIYSLFQTFQMSNGAIHYDEMTKAAYLDSFGRAKPSQLFPTFLRKIDGSMAKRGEYYTLNPRYNTILDERIDFERNDSQSSIIFASYEVDSTMSYSGENSVHSASGKLYTLNAKFPVFNADEIYITLWIKNKKKCAIVVTGNDSIPVYSASHEHIEVEDGWKKSNIFVRFKDEIKPDSLNFYIYNQSKNEIWLDDLHVMTRKVNYVPEKMDLCPFNF